MASSTASSTVASVTATPTPSTDITGHGAGSVGYIQFDLNIILVVFSTFFVALRLYCRTFIVKALGLDDAIAIVAWCLATTLSALEIYEVRNGVGKHIENIAAVDLARFFALLPTLQLLYLVATGVVRLSIVAFLPRLNKSKTYLRLVYGTGAVVISVTLICFFILLTECKHIPDLWDGASTTRECMDKTQEGYMMWTHAAIGIAIDLALMALPIWVIRANMKFSAKAVQVMLVFCVGMFAAVTGIVRLSYMVNTDFSVDTPFKMVTVSPWTDIEVHLGLWVGCFPSMQPLMKIVSYRLGLRSSLDSTRERSKYGTAGSKYGNNSHVASSKYPMPKPSTAVLSWKNTHQGYTRSESPDSAGQFTDADASSRRGIVSPGAYEMDDVEKGKIRMRTEVEVHIQQRGEVENGTKHQNTWVTR